MNDRFKSTFFVLSCYRDLNSGPLPYQGSALPLSYNSEVRAENGAQTRDPQLGRLVLYQLSYFRKLPFRKWVVMDSNHRSRKTTDLQSAPFGRSGNHPYSFSLCSKQSLSLIIDFVYPSGSFEPSKRLTSSILQALSSLLSDSNQRPRDYKSRALAN